MRSLLTAPALVLIAALAACTAQQATPAPSAIPTSAPTAAGLTPAQHAAVTSLATELAIPESHLAIVSTEAVTWPNGCLGIQPLGVMCTQSQVDGYRILLSASGKVYEVHTNEDGSNVAPVGAMQVPGPAETAGMRQLKANLGLAATDIKLVSSAPIDWPDSCLGVQQEGMLCSQVVTPGYLITFYADGRQYEYHTNQDASRILPATLAMDWKQQGGIAGVCQGMLIYASGEIFASDCGLGGDGRAGVLTQEQRAQLYSYLDQYMETTIDLSDPTGVADGMTRAARLVGSGNEQPTDDEKHVVYDLGQIVYHGLYP